MDHGKLLAAIDAKLEHAYGGDSDSEISRQRAQLIEAYLGFNTDPAPKGRSQVVDRSVFETISTLMPALVRIFAGSSDEVVKFMPVGPEDEPGAEQTTAYINFVATQKNPWEQFVADWIHDAMLVGNGYALCYWDDAERIDKEKYEGLTDEQLTAIVNDGGEITGHDARPDEEQDEINLKQWQAVAQQAMAAGMPPPPRPQPAQLHDVEIIRRDTKGKVHLCVLPPEHCVVDQDTPDWTLERCDYFEYRQEKTIADLRAMGLDVPEDVSDEIDVRDESEDYARNRFGEDLTLTSDAGEGVMRRVTSRTIWIRAAASAEDKSQLYRVIAVGRTILFAEEVSRINVVSLTPQPLPHRHPGMSVAEMVLDIQEIKTRIKRGGLDNLYLANNGRHVISDKVNLDDFLDSRPGGVVRMLDGSMPGDGHIFPLVHPFAFDQIIGSMEYFDQERQNRSGASRYFSGTDAGAINKTASGTMALQNMAAQRVEHIARMFAPAFETLFNIIHELISKHQNKADVIKLKGEWINVDPVSWQTKRDVRISVGVGAGNKDAMLAHLNLQLQEQMALLPVGVVKPENIYETEIEKSKLQGFSNPNKFWADPRQQPPQPPQPPPEIIVEQMRGQNTLQIEGAKLQQQQQANQATIAQDAQKMQRELALKHYEIEQQALLERYKIDKQAETELLKAQIAAGQQIEVTKAQMQLQGALKQAELDSGERTAARQEMKEQGRKAESETIIKAISEVAEKIDAPAEVVRDGQGKIVGVKRAGKVRNVVRDESGRVQGLQ